MYHAGFGILKTLTRITISLFWEQQWPIFGRALACTVRKLWPWCIFPEPLKCVVKRGSVDFAVWVSCASLSPPISFTCAVPLFMHKKRTLSPWVWGSKCIWSTWFLFLRYPRPTVLTNLRLPRCPNIVPIQYLCQSVALGWRSVHGTCQFRRCSWIPCYSCFSCFSWFYFPHHFASGFTTIHAKAAKILWRWIWSWVGNCQSQDQGPMQGDILVCEPLATLLELWGAHTHRIVRGLVHKAISRARKDGRIMLPGVNSIEEAYAGPKSWIATVQKKISRKKAFNSC